MQIMAARANAGFKVFNHFFLLFCITTAQLQMLRLVKIRINDDKVYSVKKEVES